MTLGNDKEKKKAFKRKVTVELTADVSPYQPIETILDVRTDGQYSYTLYLVRSGCLSLGIVDLVVYILRSTDGSYVVWANRVNENVDKKLALAAIRAMRLTSQYGDKMSVYFGETDIGMRIETERVAADSYVDVLYQDGKVVCITVEEDLYNTFPIMWHEYATCRGAAHLAVNRTSATLED